MSEPLSKAVEKRAAPMRSLHDNTAGREDDMELVAPAKSRSLKSRSLRNWIVLANIAVWAIVIVVVRWLFF